ncbi:MAG: Spo0E family sporulation regulatory protein-aspartic acid phosphatase [Tissierellia bacterium]|nr:Spo0E family sporulation regulatory protein-aspartic acid phosphatase [Tissierellia bacterium]
MGSRIELLRDLLYKEIESRKKDQEELIQISEKLDTLILEYHKEAMGE